jgi:hypothetical protein
MNRTRFASALAMAALAAIILPSFTEGMITFQRAYGGISYDVGTSAQQTTDDGYIATGYYGAGYDAVYLIKKNASGDTQWTRILDGTNSEVGNSVRQTADGGFMITGYTRHTNNEFPDFYLIKTDSLGNVAVAEPKASPTRVQALSLTCEPNPFRTRTAISFQPTANSPTELTVFDVSGRCVRTLTVDRASCAVWDGTDELGQPLPSGTYFGQVNAGNEHATARVVLQR